MKTKSKSKKQVDCALVKRLRTAVEGYDVRYQKIDAIKALRTATLETNAEGEKSYMGLGDSKWAIENWDAFIAFVNEHKRLPEPGFAYNPMN